MASNTRGRAAQENADQDDDDEFNDFGGFEAAEPAVDISASQNQAGASPWVMFNAGNVPGRPDLLCAQNRFPTYLDPSDISGTSTELTHVGLSYPVENGSVQSHADLFNGQFVENQQLDQARIAENVLDGTLSAAAVAGFLPSHAVANGRLPDIGLGINENRIFGQADDGTAAMPADNRLLPEVPQDGGDLVNWDSVEVPHGLVNRVEHENNLEAPVLVENIIVDNIAEAEPANVSNAVRVSESALQERLNGMIETNQALEAELQRVKEELATQSSRLHDIHARHTEELEEVRKAGHDALAMVVNQYKEQSRVVVIEQQELSQRHLVEVLNDQMRAFKELLQRQQELHEQQREEDRQELQRRIDIAVTESRNQQQEQFDAFLVKEQAAQRDVLEKAVEAERLTSQEHFKKALDDEHQRMGSRFAELETVWSQKLEEERIKQEMALKTALENEQRLTQEQVTLLVNEERERGRSAVRSALDASMVDVRAYIHEQRQADSRVRRRHLTSLDVFLESSRQQISLLLESEKSDLTLSTPPTDHQRSNDGSGES